jgi:hypothetical protein
VQQVSFVIRATSPDQGRTIRGQIEHVPSGTTTHFRDLEQVYLFINSYLAAAAAIDETAAPAIGERVSSIFSFLRRRATRAGGEPSSLPEPPPEGGDEADVVAAPGPAEPAPGITPPVIVLTTPPAGTPPEAAPAADTTSPVIVLTTPLAGTPPEAAGEAAQPELFEAGVFSDTPSAVPPTSMEPYITSLLNHMRAYLPANAPNQPANTLSIVSLSYRSLGIGGWHGMERLSGMAEIGIRGGFLEATVRYDIWAADVTALSNAAAALQRAIGADVVRLRRRQILQLKLVGISDGTGANANQLRRSLDYEVLYEYQYLDSDNAASLIARIPIEHGTDLAALPTIEVRDWMVRWDNIEAPTLVVSPVGTGTLRVRGLTIAAFFPGAGPGGQVTRRVIRNGVTETTDLGSPGDFLSRFVLALQPLTLVFPPRPLLPGETQELRDFQVGQLLFPAPIVLNGSGERFEIAFSAPAFPAATPSQVYLQAIVEKSVVRSS